MSKYVLLALGLFFSMQIIAQTGIGTTTPHASAKLEVASVNKGFLPPRLTLTSVTDASTIASPAEGLLVYNLGSVGLQAGYYYWNGANWSTIATATSAGNGVTSMDMVKLYSKVYSTTSGDIAHANGFDFTVPVSGRYLFDFSSSGYLNQSTMSITFKVRQGTTDLATDVFTNANNNVHVVFTGMVEVNLQASTTYNVYVSTTGSRDGGDYDRVFYKLVAGTIPVNQYTVGDVKTGMQTIDHNGWVKLDGRAKSTLSSTQQTQATSLGIGANLPNANNSVLMQTSTGTVGTTYGSNSKTITQANLPSYDLPAATTSSIGNHTHAFQDVIWSENRNQNNRTVGAGAATDYDNDPYFRSAITDPGGSHSHTVTVSSGGSGTALDVTPQYLKVNTFIYLGY